MVRTGEFTETWKWELGTDEFQDAGVIIYSIHIKKQIYIYIDKYAYVHIYIYLLRSLRRLPLSLYPSRQADERNQGPTTANIGLTNRG